MILKIKKWGNSQGLIFVKPILEEAKIYIGDDVDITAKEGQITIKKVEFQKMKYKLSNLISKMPKKYKISEEDWGEPVGREIW